MEASRAELGRFQATNHQEWRLGHVKQVTCAAVRDGHGQALRPDDLQTRAKRLRHQDHRVYI